MCKLDLWQWLSIHRVQSHVNLLELSSLVKAWSHNLQCAICLQLNRVLILALKILQ